MDKKTCPYCKKEFIPNHARRKYCCDSHRVNHFNKRKGFKVTKIAPEEQQEETTNQEQEGMTKPMPVRLKRTGKEKAGDAMIDTAVFIAANRLSERLKAEPNRAATKGDLLEVYNDLVKEIRKNKDEPGVKLDMG